MAKKKIKQEKSEELERQELVFENQLRKALADYQNLEKRVALEKEELIRSANRGLILRLLPALDTLLLADKHTQDEGLRLSVKQIFDTLEKEGLKKIETKDQEFNPEFMEAVHVVEGGPSAGSGQAGQGEGKVIEELRPGYLFNDKVLRVAQVSVGHRVENS